MNRYVFVLNNPLRYVDPDGLKETDPWNQLSEEEQNIIAKKLVIGKGQTAQQVFNKLAVNSGNATEAVAAIKNLIDIVGGHSKSAVWQQITSINQITGGEHSLIHVTVGDKFLDALKNEKDANGNPKFVVNDRLDKMFGDHQFNTIRQTTEYSGLEADKPANPIHFANDLGGSLYFTHFDPTSPYFRTSRYSKWNPLYPELVLKEMRDAAKAHNDPNRQVTPSQVREYLKRTGQVPAGEK